MAKTGRQVAERSETWSSRSLEALRDTPCFFLRSRLLHPPPTAQAAAPLRSRRKRVWLERMYAFPTRRCGVLLFRRHKYIKRTVIARRFNDEAIRFLLFISDCFSGGGYGLLRFARNDSGLDAARRRGGYQPPTIHGIAQ